MASREATDQRSKLNFNHFMASDQMDSNTVSDPILPVPAFLSRPGGMSERIFRFKWSETSLGAIPDWPASLRSAVSISLNSNFPIAIYWGRDLLLLYNDAWTPIPGNKHPWALGRPAREVWPDIWEEIAPQFEKAFAGEPGGSKNAMLPMQRHGYTEECYFDFTFTPLYGEQGRVEGIFNAVVETTYQLIHERRTSFLHRLSQKMSSSVTMDEVFKKINALIRNNPTDIPFCYIYSLPASGEPVLESASAGSMLIKKLPYADLVRNGNTKHIPILSSYLDKVPEGTWPELPSEGLLVPLKAGNGLITGFIFAGLNARRRNDREYQLFVEGMATVIGTAINSIHALEEERRRTEVIDNARIKLEKSEADLRLANEQLELTFSNVPAAIYLFDRDGKIILLNHQANRASGNNNDRAIEEGLDLERIHERVARLFDLRDESGDIFPMENTPARVAFRLSKPAQEIIQFIHKETGQHRWILASASPLLDESGKLKMVLACSTDITVQKQAEEKIREREENFRRLTQALPQLVWVTDAAGHQEFVTERWKEYTGLDPRDTRTWALIVHPDDSRGLAQIWTSCLKTGTTYKAEARLKSKTGIYRWFHVHGEPILNDKMEIVQWVGAFTDIDEQKQAEDLLRQSEGQLEFLVKKRTEELERSNEDLQQFAHVASHDLKEPIRKIKIFTGMLEEELDPQINDKAKLFLSKIQSATERMLLMMEGVLRYAGLDGYDHDAGIVDVNEILKSVETDLETVIEKRNASIERDHFPEIPGYTILIYQLFYNLLSNALKFSRPDIETKIRIQYRQTTIHTTPFAEFTISDNGIGFESENADKIFNTFLRLNAREDYEGTGLGLSLCKKIVARHHGFISAKGEVGLGAVFTVLLPLNPVRS